jgi:hypothetical protein
MSRSHALVTKKRDKKSVRRNEKRRDGKLHLEGATSASGSSRLDKYGNPARSLSSKMLRGSGAGAILDAAREFSSVIAERAALRTTLAKDDKEWYAVPVSVKVPDCVRAVERQPAPLFKIDPKLDPKVRLAEVDKVVALLRAEVGMLFGRRPVKVSLPSGTSTFMTAAIASGIVNTSVTVFPSDPSEYSSLATLFDEGKMIGVDVRWTNANLVAAASGASAATADNTWGVCCADPGNGTTLTSVAAGRQSAHHVLYHLLTSAAGTTPTADTSREFDMKVRFPAAQTFTNMGAVAYEQDWWQETNVTPAAYCLLKSYTVQTIVTATKIAQAQLMYYYEFRLRA